MQQIDRKAIFEYGIPSLVLMENAGRAVAEEVIKIAKPSSKIFVVCGKGNNGGDGLVCARHLHNKGFKVKVLLLSKLRDLTGESDFTKNLGVVQKIKIDITDDISSINEADIIVDAIFGTGLDREVKGAEKRAIETINESSATVFSVDVPSGLDCNSGDSLGVCVKAHKTVTMGLPKIGFDNAKSLTGEIIISDIGIPMALLK